MEAYRATTEIPPLVREAQALARRMKFELSCIDEVGRLLMVLAGQVRQGLVAEIGTGCGVGAAWITSGLMPDVSFLTVEIDSTRAAAAQALFERFPHVRVIHGDWHEILTAAPFAMLFPDGGKAKQLEPDLLVQSLQPGGLIVLDDLTREDTDAFKSRRSPDPVRAFWLNDRRVIATELPISSTQAAILATRVR